MTRSILASIEPVGGSCGGRPVLRQYGRVMRVVIAPAEFKGSLTATAAARAMAQGWSQTAPSDDLDICPLSDGGPGFVGAMASSLGGRLEAVTVRGPHGEAVPGTVLMVGETAYIESAQACGIHLVPEHRYAPDTASTFGVGELVRAALDLGARRIIVGLGGSATTDGGAGLLAALGATSDAQLDAGGFALRDMTAIDISAALAAVEGVEILAATDVDSPLLGLTGAAKVFGPQKGATEEQVFALDAALTTLASQIGRRADGKDPSVAKGSGAAGGLGYALMCLGAVRVPGIETVSTAAKLSERIQAADLVVTGEGCFDWQSMRGKVVTGVALAALPTLRPCVVIAGSVVVGRREYSTLGVAGAYSVADVVGSMEVSLADPVGSLTRATARVARTWSS